MRTNWKLIELFFIQKALSELKIMTAEVLPLMLTILPGFFKVGRMVHMKRTKIFVLDFEEI
jgi:hypothetical protein